MAAGRVESFVCGSSGGTKSWLLEFKPHTPLNTNIAAENRPFHNHHFSVAMLVSGRVSVPTIVVMEEIQRSPVEGKVVLSHDLQGFIHPRWLALGFLNHQQYQVVFFRQR